MEIHDFTLIYGYTCSISDFSLKYYRENSRKNNFKLYAALSSMIKSFYLTLSCIGHDIFCCPACLHYMYYLPICPLTISVTRSTITTSVCSYNYSTLFLPFVVILYQHFQVCFYFYFRGIFCRERSLSSLGSLPKWIQYQSWADLIPEDSSHSAM